MIALVTEVNNIYYMKFVKTSKLAPYDQHEVTQFIAQFPATDMIKQIIMSSDFHVFTWGDRVGRLRPSSEHFEYRRRFRSYDTMWDYIDDSHPLIEGLLLKNGTWRHFYGDYVDPDDKDIPRFELTCSNVVEYVETIGYEPIKPDKAPINDINQPETMVVQIGDIVHATNPESDFDGFYLVTRNNQTSFTVTVLAYKAVHAEDSLIQEAIYHFYAASPDTYDNINRITCQLIIHAIYRK